ncbi:hypothetical protein D7D25_05715 [Proteiniphilum sp. X52]|nr:hypothetical protein D7D25_05715 [Proteiniphilum sp. X52]
MQDIIITSKRIRKEITILLVCFITAFIINVVAIAVYKTSWIEVVTQIGYVIVITIFLYLIVAVFRFISAKIIRLVKKS